MSLSANETADSKGQQQEGAQLPWRISDPGQPEFEDSVVLLTKIVHSKVDSSDRESLDEMAHKYAARLVDEFLSRDDDPELQLFYLNSPSCFDAGKLCASVYSSPANEISSFRHPSPCVLIPVLSTLRNIAKGDDSQRQCIIDHRVLHHLRSLLDTSDNLAVKKKACQTISAIAAGNEKQTQVVIDAKLIEPLTSLLKDEESSLKEDAVQAVRDVISFGTRKGINVLGLKDFVEPLCDLLVCSDPKILTVCLEGLSMLCKPKSGGALNDFVMWTDHCKGLDRIKDLKRHGNPDIRDIALSSWDMIYEEALKLWKFYDEMGELQVRVGS
ncbi:OLC1v1002518C1 [Oldenlandia corymbosa var. corymbosa]|uniref:OLC1v1002518C1 n=1 Tax=Oldenlandia corymbosa var. corymbosa TaxID=529605 RepID=A0AAV1D8J0_OLDCO|nr:OLC1v1002518C1 [Oldenlandia corymbosa var. corymbosa]